MTETPLSVGNHDQLCTHIQALGRQEPSKWQETFFQEGGLDRFDAHLNIRAGGGSTGAGFVCVRMSELVAPLQALDKPQGPACYMSYAHQGSRLHTSKHGHVHPLAHRPAPLLTYAIPTIPISPCRGRLPVPSSIALEYHETCMHIQISPAKPHNHL